MPTYLHPVLAAISKNASQAEALTTRVAEVQGRLPSIVGAFTTISACVLTRCAVPIAAEKDSLEKALKQVKEDNKTRTTELGKVQEEMTRLQADAEKLKEENRLQIKQVTESAATEIANAKTEFEDKEKLLRAEIESLKRENQSLKDTEKLQKE